MKQVVRTCLTAGSFHLLRLVSFRARVAGLEVVVGADIEPRGAVASISAALLELARADPLRMSRVRRFLRRVVVVDHVPGGLYEPVLDACLLGPKLVLSGDRTRIAAVIVHESTHARLHHCGFRYDSASRQRQEMLCVAESARFLRKAGMPERAEEQEARLARELASENPWFTDERRREAADTALKQHGAPGWIRRIRRYLAGP